MAAKPVLGRAAAVASVVFAGFVTTGCGPVITTVTPGADCSLTTHNFHQSNGSPDYMGAKATGQCDVMVSKMKIWVDLERQNSNGSWSKVFTDTSPAEYADVRGNKGKVGQGFMLCDEGTYRGAGRASYQYRGVWYNGTTDYGPPATDVC